VLRVSFLALRRCGSIFAAACAIGDVALEL
jgi:hypothetical protein